MSDTQQLQRVIEETSQRIVKAIHDLEATLISELSSVKAELEEIARNTSKTEE